MTETERLANSSQFDLASQAERAEMMLWAICSLGKKDAASIIEVADAFVALGLHRPNVTRIRDHFRKSKNIRSASGKFAVVRDFSQRMMSLFPAEIIDVEHLTKLDGIDLPPFVPPERKEDLQRMVGAYARLFLLENSMRGLIEKVLSEKLGSDWWDKAANASMKKKHADREKNEQSKKWAPARVEYGPLYALDWPDLITVIRKYPEHFLSIIKDINFLHRYEDAGTFRNVVAHNGVLREQDDFDLIRIYYQNWIKQLL